MEGHNNFYGPVTFNAAATRRSRRPQRVRGQEQQRGGGRGQPAPQLAYRGAAFGRGGYQQRRAVPYQPAVRGFGRGGNRGGFHNQANNRGWNQPQRGVNQPQRGVD